MERRLRRSIPVLLAAALPAAAQRHLAFHPSIAPKLKLPWVLHQRAPLAPQAGIVLDPMDEYRVVANFWTKGRVVAEDFSAFEPYPCLPLRVNLIPDGVVEVRLPKGGPPIRTYAFTPESPGKVELMKEVDGYRVWLHGFPSGEPTLLALYRGTNTVPLLFWLCPRPLPPGPSASPMVLTKR